MFFPASVGWSLGSRAVLGRLSRGAETWSERPPGAYGLHVRDAIPPKRSASQPPACASACAWLPKLLVSVPDEGKLLGAEGGAEKLTETGETA